jgi:hypothetical protein
MLVPEILAAGGGLLFAFDHATIAGKIVLTLKDAQHTQLTVARDRVRTIKDRLGI